jgi:hypothetical protein
MYYWNFVTVCGLGYMCTFFYIPHRVLFHIPFLWMFLVLPLVGHIFLCVYEVSA